MRILLVVCICFIIGQGCSWIHWFEVKNDTESDWLITYVLVDDRGIFKNTVSFYTHRPKQSDQISYPASRVEFNLKPDQIACIGSSSSTHFNVYEKALHFHPKTPWKPFLNIESITFSNGELLCTIPIQEIDQLLIRNTKQSARISLKKVKLFCENTSLV